MKRAAVTVVFSFAVAALGGCPSSSNSSADGCYRDDDCGSGYLCDRPSGECFVASDGGEGSCTVPADCAASFTCSKNGRCLPGDCYFNDCVAGFSCESSTGTWQCLPSSAGAAGAAGAGEDEMTQAGVGGATD